MINLVTEQPIWFVIFCILLGFLFAWFLYRNDKRTYDLSKLLRSILFMLRFFFITVLSFLLLSPLLKTITRQTEKPIVIVAQDNSESIIINKDSSYYRNEYPQKMNSMISELKKKFDVHTISFGDKMQDDIHYSYSDKQTDYSLLLNSLNVRFANRNVGAVIIATDGLYNRGSSPVFSSDDLSSPVYTIALGDTTAKKDLRIANVRYNKVAFLNSTFPVEIVLEARQCNGGSTTLTLLEDSSILFSKSVSIPGSTFSQTIPVYLDAKKKGLHHYRIEASGINNEVTLENNVKDIYIQVEESKRKILIIADSPHPDIAALKEAIESNENYEADVQMITKFDAKMNDYQLIILHQLPSTDHPAMEIITEIKKTQISAWYIVGTQTNVKAFNSLSSPVSIGGDLNKTNYIQPALNKNFSLFTIGDNVLTALPNFPPLMAPFGDYKTSTAGASLLVQQIGNVTTNQPLLFLSSSNESKDAVLCGEGLWRWKLNDYQLNGNFNAFNEIISKTIQYLSTREVRRQFKVIAKNIFPENEPIMFDAEVYNENYELINTPDIAVAITNENGKSFPYTFSKSERAYSLNAGIFSPGRYHYKATVKIGEKPFTSEGDFSVSALQAEKMETVADHSLLYSWAHKKGGEMFYPAQLNELSKLLLSKEEIKTVSYSQVKLLDLVNLKWVFFLLLVFISVEWFLRKRNGLY
jgi:hypothetical protein